MGLKVIILAAGKGKRMVSERPKVMFKLGGMTLLERVVGTTQALNADEIHVVYGKGVALMLDQLTELPVNWVFQEKQLGTGHAVMQAISECDDDDQVMVLYGDAPLISANTLQQLMHDTPHHGLGLVVVELENPSGMGRIIRNEMGNIMAIVEHKDADLQQREIKEVNTGILMTQAAHLKQWLPQLDNRNKQQEYYLTDVVALAVNEGYPVGGVLAHCPEEVQGANDCWQLAELERFYQHSQAKALAYAGVTIMDPNRLDIRGEVDIGSDVTLDVNVVLEGRVTIGDQSVIGANVVLNNVSIGKNVKILANCVIEDTTIADHCQIGPFARLRPGTEVDKGAKIGNFVETKKTRIGIGSKASHLTYLGDSIIGDHVNIGAGTITCNYDGVNKFETRIDDNAFIGSNTSLLAPIHIAQNAYIAAGSTLNQNAPEDQLTIARAKQTTIKGWRRPKKHKKQ